MALFNAAIGDFRAAEADPSAAPARWLYLLMVGRCQSDSAQTEALLTLRGACSAAAELATNTQGGIGSEAPSAEHTALATCLAEVYMYVAELLKQLRSLCPNGEDQNLDEAGEDEDYEEEYDD